VKAHQPKKGSGRKRTQAQRKEVSNNIERDAASNEEDPFINVAVAFSPNSDLCQQLIRGEWKKKWSTHAVCYHLDKHVGHIVGRIIRKTKCTGRKKTQSVFYDVAWEYSSLGISEVPYKYVLDGNKVGEKLMEVRANVRQQAFTISNRRDMISRIRAERDVSDDDDKGIVPTFLDDSSANSISSTDDVEGSELEWCVLNGLDSNLTRSDVLEATPNGDEQGEPDFTGFHWSFDGQINTSPPEKMPFKKSTVKPSCHQLFVTPMDSVMAMFLMNFWEVIVRETNRYAIQKLQKRSKRPGLISGYKWKPVVVQEMFNIVKNTLCFLPSSTLCFPDNSSNNVSYMFI
jgi:hypothetical protein